MRQRIFRLLLLLIALSWTALTAGPTDAGPAEVRQIQQRLNDLGYDPGPVDGAWGRRTESAARKFLSGRGLSEADVWLWDWSDHSRLLNFLRTHSVQVGTAEPARAVVMPQIAFSTAQTVGFSPDGELIVTGDGNNIRLWDVATSRLLRVLKGHASNIKMAEFTPDGSRIVSVDWMEATAKVWNAETGNLLLSFRAYQSRFIEGVSLSPDGSRLLTTNGSSIKMWDTGSGKLVRTFGEDIYDWKGSVAFSPDGSRFVSRDGTGANAKLRVWDVLSGRLLRTMGIGGSSLKTVAYSPDGSMIAVGADVRGTNESALTLRNAYDGSLIRTFKGVEKGDHGFEKEIVTIAFSPDGTHIASCTDFGPAHLWNVATGRLVRSAGDSSCSDIIDFSPDGRRLAVGTEIWNIKTGELRDLAANAGFKPVGQAFFLPGGAQVISESWPNISFWDLGAGRLVRTVGDKDADHVLMPEIGIRGFAVTPDGSKIIVDGGEEHGLLLVDTQSNRVVRKFGVRSDSVSEMAVLPDGKHVGLGIGNLIMVLSLATGEIIHTIRGAGAGGMAISRDGKLVATAGYSDGTRIWNVAAGNRISTISGDFDSVAFLSNGDQVITGADSSSDSTLDLWDVRTGKLIRSFADKAIPFGGYPAKPRAHTQDIISVGVSSDGRRIASGSEDNLVKLWEGATGNLIRTFRGHQEQVNSVSFSPDDKRLLSSSSDGTIRIWDPQQDEPLVTLMEMRKGWLVVTPEGFFAGTHGAARALVVVRGLESYSIDQFYQALYRPDLVREKLAGDPDGKVREAAAKLDLDKIIDSGGSPSVAIVSPVDSKSVTDDNLTVEAKITDTGGGIGRIEWRVNGLTLGVNTKRGFERIAAGAKENEQKDDKSITVRQDLWLEPGKNTIEVVAYNAKNLIASDPAKITITWDGQTSKTPPRLHVLAVGVNDYWDSRLRLNHAVTDAKAMSTALRQAGGGLYETVSVTNLVDDQVTADKLEAAFDKLGGDVRPRDVFLFFLAGHGKTVDGKYFFIPQDFRYKTPKSIVDKGIGQDKWQRWFSRIPARKSLLLYDTCESGSLTGDRILTRSMERIAALEKLTRAMGRTVLSAATDEAPALEGYKGHGVFTYALLDALNRSDANKNDLIEVTELAGHVDAQVPEISHKAFGFRQVPQMKIVGSNFPLARRTAVLKQTDTASPAIATKPSHIVVKPAGIFVEPGEAGTVLQTLKPGTAVTLIKTEQGWSLIARDGKRLGYVSTSDLLEIQ